MTRISNTPISKIDRLVKRTPEHDISIDGVNIVTFVVVDNYNFFDALDTVMHSVEESRDTQLIEFVGSLLCPFNYDDPWTHNTNGADVWGMTQTRLHMLACLIQEFT